MILFKSLRASKENQLKRYIFVYIVMILFCLLFIFLLLNNLDYVWDNISKENKIKVEEDAGHKKIEALAEIQKTREPDAEGDTNRDVLIWGKETEGFHTVALQLSGMKEAFGVADSLQDCEEAKLLFICKKSLTDEEINRLGQYSKGD